jgi:2,3-bisphosphoglycerate-independent phosphoglycerate mutase
MTRLLMLFLDGVGLGADDSERNPFAVARMPVLIDLLDGRRLLACSTPFIGEQATLLSVDACLNVDGLPQSATGQASLLTGRNVPAEIGYHYGPKPNRVIRDILAEENVFSTVRRAGGNAALLNAYPPRYFETIRSGRRLYSAIPFALTAAGFELMTDDDLRQGGALSADFTGAGWVAQPDFPPAPVYSPAEAGELLAAISRSYALSWFDYWPTDYAGHRASFEEALELLATVDGVLGGLLSTWEKRTDLIVITSDHGNLEDLSVRGHTRNPVPALLIGPADLRSQFSANLHDLTDFSDAIITTILEHEHNPPRRT